MSLVCMGCLKKKKKQNTLKTQTQPSTGKKEILILYTLQTPLQTRCLYLAFANLAPALFSFPMFCSWQSIFQTRHLLICRVKRDGRDGEGTEARTPNGDLSCVLQIRKDTHSPSPHHWVSASSKATDKAKLRGLWVLCIIRNSNWRLQCKQLMGLQMQKTARLIIPSISTTKKPLKIFRFCIKSWNETMCAQFQTSYPW